MESNGGYCLYDLCIVGAGMVGSAIARHASAVGGKRICVVGPQEPRIRKSETGKDIFGAHYDSGRMTSSYATDLVWAKLASESIKRYEELERTTGVTFYHQVGCLSAGSKTFVESEQNRLVTLDEIKTTLSYLEFSKNDSFLLNSQGGWIDPRKLISAQLISASNQGCDIIRDIVKTVEKVRNNEPDALMVIQTERGNTIKAKKVVLATNAFINYRDLLPKPMKAAFTASPQTVVFGEVCGEDLAKIRSMPSILYSGMGGQSWYGSYPRGNDGCIGYYMMPPILYPDGKYYIKLGHSDSILKRYLSNDEISRWHCSGGDPWLIDNLKQLLQTMFKGITFQSFNSDSCVTMVTPTRRPYIDKVHDQLGVAIGGNGYAAKSSDEIGRLAAAMMLNIKPESDIPMDTFKLVFDNTDIVSKL